VINLKKNEQKKERKEYMKEYMKDYRKKEPEKVKQITLNYYKKKLKENDENE
jgi:hypothetical protein